MWGTEIKHKPVTEAIRVWRTMFETTYPLLDLWLMFVEDHCAASGVSQRLWEEFPLLVKQCPESMEAFQSFQSSEINAFYLFAAQILGFTPKPLDMKPAPIESKVCSDKTQESIKVSDKRASGYVGLENQGATCYLNSLLQTLFMIPEFRNKIYEVAKEPGAPKGSVSYELFEVFLRLQIAQRKDVTTTSLTKTFGWDERDAFEQHDVQELARKMLEEVEKDSRALHPDSPSILELFEGKCFEYVKCKTCGFNSGRTSSFLDLSVSIRDSGSLEEALSKYFAEEELSGINSYQCPKCNKKVDAEKGIQLEYCPPIISVVLLRFDMDWVNLHRIKINSQVLFPPTFDFCWYMKSPMKKEYDLFAVLVHSGSAVGGHYFVFIKDYVSGQWLRFDDSEVSICEEKVVFESCGGSGSSANAYMLFYRDRSSIIPEVEDITKSISPELVAKIRAEDLEHNETHNPDFVEVIVFWRDSMLKIQKRLIRVNKKLPLKDVEEKVYETEFASMAQFLQLERHQYRLRSYNQYMDELLSPFKSSELIESLESLKFSSGKPLFLETRAMKEDWPVSMVDMFSLHVSQASMANHPGESDSTLVVGNHKVLNISKTSSVVQFQLEIEKSFLIPSHDLILWKITQTMYNRKALALPIGTSTTLSACGLFSGCSIYVATMDDSKEVEFALEEGKNLVTIKFNRPDSPSDFTETADCDRSKPLIVLKKEIARRLGLHPSSFTLAKAAIALSEGVVFEDEMILAGDLSITDKSNILVKLGTVKSSQMAIRIFLISKSSESQQMDLKFMFELETDPSALVEELAGLVSEKLKDVWDIRISARNIRIRTLVDDAIPFKVVSRSNTIKQCFMTSLLMPFSIEDKSFCIQEVSEEDISMDETRVEEESSAFVSFQKFGSFEGDSKENLNHDMWINVYDTLGNLAFLLTSVFKIPKEHLSFMKHDPYKSIPVSESSSSWKLLIDPAIRTEVSWFIAMA